MTYDIRIWEQIRSAVECKTRKLEEDIKAEIAQDRSLREFQCMYPIPWQLREGLKQRAEWWIQRLYDPCCEAHETNGGELAEFDRAVWAYWIEPFIMREVQTTADGYRGSKLMELLLCAVGSTPENRRYLKTGQKDCCVRVRTEIHETWYSKLHHLPSKLDEAVRAMSAYKAREARAARIVRGLPPDPSPSPINDCSTIPSQIPTSSTSVPMQQTADDSIVSKASSFGLDVLGEVDLPEEKSADCVDAQRELSRSTISLKPKNSAAKNWQSIEILFLSDHRVQIRIESKNMETLNYAEFGFADGRSHTPNKAWEVLRALAEQRGIIRDGKIVGEPWSKIEKRVQEIRKGLREYFGLPSDPIIFVENVGYQAIFKIGCAPSFHA